MTDTVVLALFFCSAVSLMKVLYEPSWSKRIISDWVWDKI